MSLSTDILIFTQLNNIWYIGTNSTNEESNGFVEGATIPQKLIIPKYYNKNLIQAVGAYAFFQIREIYEVVIEAPVIEIHKAAFHGCTNLRSINIPATVTFLGQSAMDGRVVDTQEIGNGPMTYYFEKGSSITTIMLAAICNYKTIIVYINDIVNPSCDSSSFLTGAEKWTVFSPYSYKLCGRQTTVINKQITSQNSHYILLKFILQGLICEISLK